MNRLTRRVSSRVVTAVFLALFALLAFVGAHEADPAPVRFGLFTDLHAHDRDSPLEEKWMSHTEERLDAFCAYMNAAAVDFVVQLGDFVNGWVVFGTDPGDPARLPQILAWADEVYARFHGPRYHVVGNHDTYNLDKTTIRNVLGLERTYYSFTLRSYHFVVLDVQYAEDGSDLAHTYTGVAGFVPPEELEWLEQDLRASEEPTLIFVHQMLDTYVEEWGRPLVANQAQVQAVLSSDPDVIAVFQGHDHAYRRQRIDGIDYVTFEALVDRGTPPSWALVTLDSSRGTITIEGSGAQPSLAFSYEVRREQ